MSDRYLRSGDSEFTPAEKPFVINPRSRADMVRSIRVPDWLAFPLVRAILDQGNEAIQFGSTAYHPAMRDPVRSREYTATEGFWPGHGRRNPGLSGVAALIRISPNFRLTGKGQSIMIRRQE